MPKIQGGSYRGSINFIGATGTYTVESNARAGGSNSRFASVPLPRPAEFTANDQTLTNIVVSSGGPTGLTAIFAGSGTTSIGAPTQKRAGVTSEVLLGDKILRDGELHKTGVSGWEVLNVGAALTQLRNGFWVNSGGTPVVPSGIRYFLGSGVAGASGDISAASTPGTPLAYHFRNAKADTQLYLPPRKQA